MLTVLTRLATHASAGASACSAAAVSDVWALLADPARWPEYEPAFRSVTAVPSGEPAPVAVGQRLRAQVRLMPHQVPIEIDHVVPRSSIAMTAQLFPGLAEEVEHLVLPSATGGTQVTARIRLHGPLALPALLPRWAARAVTVRLLARAAEGRLRKSSREIPSVA
jgi:hypothetical protein